METVPSWSTSPETRHRKLPSALIWKVSDCIWIEAGKWAASFRASVSLPIQGVTVWFTDHGGLTRANGQHFRDTMLAPGHTADPMVLYRTFRGHDPDTAPLLRQRGLDGTAG